MIRETEQHGVVIIPIVLDCSDIASVLKDKLFVDFREDSDAGFKKILNVIANKYNIGNSGRIASGTIYYFDYGIDQSIVDERFL